MSEEDRLETSSEDKWRKILKQPFFNCCGDCPLVKRIEEMVKHSPASPEVEEAFKLIKKDAPDPFDHPRVEVDKLTTEANREGQRDMLEKVYETMRTADKLAPEMGVLFKSAMNMLLSDIEAQL